MAKRAKKITTNDLLEFIRHEGACQKSIEWVEQNRAFDAETLWNRCNRFDWIVWLSDETVGHLRVTDALSDTNLNAESVPTKVTKREREKFMRRVRWRDVANALRSRIGGE